jgi:hypothetical protein
MRRRRRHLVPRLLQSELTIVKCLCSSSSSFSSRSLLLLLTPHLVAVFSIFQMAGRRAYTAHLAIPPTVVILPLVELEERTDVIRRIMK